MSKTCIVQAFSPKKKRKGDAQQKETVTRSRKLPLASRGSLLHPRAMTGSGPTTCWSRSVKGNKKRQGQVFPNKGRNSDEKFPPHRLWSGGASLHFLFPPQRRKKFRQGKFPSLFPHTFFGQGGQCQIFCCMTKTES
jgi:hypothetical protein